MKKFLMMHLTFILTIGLHAQPISFGIKGGVNIATMLSGNTGHAGSKKAYHAGVLARIPLNTKWSIQPEVIYSRQGIRQNLSGSNYDINLDYINVPLLFQLLIKKGLIAEAGPQIGLLLRAKNIYQGVERNIQSNYKAIDLSFPMGMSFTWISGFGINARWVPGLSEITKDYGTSKNSVFQFGIFYQLIKSTKNNQTIVDNFGYELL